MGVLNKNSNKVHIISIGDEILIGQINNTNASWMAGILNLNGFETLGIYSIGDNDKAIKDALDYSIQKADLVLVTGGLGPTKDDITKNVVAHYLDSELIIHEETLAHVSNFFAKRGKELTELNRRQALIPDKCFPIFNKVGTAPGMYFVKEDTHFVFMPGVPFEMKFIMENWVIPKMTEILNTKKIYQKTILTHGIGESFLAELISEWENNLPEFIKLAYLPSPGKVRLRLRATGGDRNKLESAVELQINKLRDIIDADIFGYEDDKMEAVVGNLLLAKNQTLCTAESCTGGYIAHLLTEIPGSSKYFRGSVVSYSNESKNKVLHVPNSLIDNFGAVSEEVVKAMAVSARKIFNTDFAIATSGIAGPDGGTDEKPVGTVWIALDSEKGCVAKKFQFGDHRLRNINMSSSAALNLLRLELIKSEN